MNQNGSEAVLLLPRTPDVNTGLLRNKKMVELIDIKEIEIITANKRLIKSRGRFISNPKYSEFKKHLFYVCKNIKLLPCYHIQIYAECNCDIDNVIKPILDALEMKGVITNDRDVLVLKCYKRHISPRKPGMIIVCGEGGLEDTIGSEAIKMVDGYEKTDRDM